MEQFIYDTFKKRGGVLFDVKIRVFFDCHLVVEFFTCRIGLNRVAPARFGCICFKLLVCRRGLGVSQYLS